MKISVNEVRQASKNWKKEIGSLEGLLTFVCLDPDNESRYDEFNQFEVPDETVHRIKLLTGPHYQTIIKMYLIQKEANENAAIHG